MLIKEIMTKPVITIPPHTTVQDACMIYKNKKVGCLLIEENRTCLGLVTERDIIERTICLRKNPEKTQVADIMTTDLHCVSPLQTLEKALEKMNKYQIKKLPVIINNELIGIVTVTDISRAKPELTERFIDSWIQPRWID